MPMYVTFITLLENYEIAIHAHNYRFFWKELCFNYLISTLWIFQLYEGWAFFYLFWVSQYDPYQAPPVHLPLTTFILEEEELIQY